MKILISIASYVFLTSNIIAYNYDDKTKNTDPISTKEHKINMDYLTDTRGWKLYRITSDKPCDTNNDGIKNTEIIQEMPTCALDDMLFIRKENNKAYYERGILCDNQPKEEAYDWTLLDNKFIMSQGNDSPDTMEIISLDDKKMVMAIQMEALGELYIFTVTFKH